MNSMTNRDDQVRADLVAYVDLLRWFVDGQLSAPEFERRYLRLVKDDQVIHGEPAFGIIDGLFFYVDEYFDDPDYTEQQRVAAEDELRGHARDALSALAAVR
jgi:self-protective colicin-like immunity protein